MIDQINENYQSSLSSLKEMKDHEDFIENGQIVNEEFIEALDGILESDQLILESADVDAALVLSEETNISIFETIKGSAYNTLFAEATDDTAKDNEDNGDAADDGTASENELYPGPVKPGNKDKHEATDDTSEDDEDNGDSEDDGSADTEERHPQMKPDFVKEAYGDENEDEDEDEDDNEAKAQDESAINEMPDDEEDDDDDDDDEDEKTEAIDPNDKSDIQSTIMELIQADSYIIRTHLDEDGWLINHNSPYFAAIQESLFEQFAGICEAFDDVELYNDFVEALEEQAELDAQGMGLVEKLSKKDKAAIAAGTAGSAGLVAGRKNVKKASIGAYKGVKSGYKGITAAVKSAKKGVTTAASATKKAVRSAPRLVKKGVIQGAKGALKGLKVAGKSAGKAAMASGKHLKKHKGKYGTAASAAALAGSGYHVLKRAKNEGVELQELSLGKLVAAGAKNIGKGKFKAGAKLIGKGIKANPIKTGLGLGAAAGTAGVVRSKLRKKQIAKEGYIKGAAKIGAGLGAFMVGRKIAKPVIGTGAAVGRAVTGVKSDKQQMKSDFQMRKSNIKNKAKLKALKKKYN